MAVACLLAAGCGEQRRAAGAASGVGPGGGELGGAEGEGEGEVTAPDGPVATDDGEDPSEAPDHDERTLTLEVMVGTDSAMTARYGEGLDDYVRRLMEQVHYMYAKLAPETDVNVVLARHERDVDLRGLELSADKDVLLGRWIDWAKADNVDDDTDPAHFDYSFLLTKSEFGTGWALTGVPICDAAAASVVFDKGHITAKVIAHETGHSFGLGHVDGPNHIMHANPGTTWSEEAQGFFAGVTRDAEPCLTDFQPRPDYPAVPAISRESQCESTFELPVCTLFELDIQCEKLACATDEWNCVWDDSPPLDGTPCGEGAWCIAGECVPAEGAP